MNEQESGVAPGAPAADGVAERKTLRTMLVGGAAAGLVGAVLVLLTEREEEPQPVSMLEQARMAIDDAGRRVSHDTKASRKQAKKRTRKVSRKTRRQQEQAQTQIMNLLAQARDEVRGKVSDARSGSPDLAGIVDQAKSQASDLAGDARRRGKHLEKQTKQRVASSKADTSSLVEALRSRASDVERLAGSYVESTVLPKLKELEKDATDRFEAGKKDARHKAESTREHLENEVLQEARKRASELRTSVEDDILPDVKEHVGSLQKRAEEEWVPHAKATAEDLRKRAESEYLPEARKQAAHVKTSLSDQADITAQRWEQGKDEAAKRLAEASEAAKAQTREAEEAIRRGGRESRSLLIWMSLAGVLVYKVFLNDEQQKKVRETSLQLLGEAKDMYNDMKGHA